MEHYIQLCVDHLSDKATYERQRAPVEALTRLVRTRVRNWYQYVAKTYAYYTDWDTTRIIVASLPNARLNVFYALAKIHKPLLCIRPIVSNSGSVFEGISKWLDYMLQPIYQSTQTYLRNSDQLLHDLPKQTLSPDTLLITVDVESLYTNIPIGKALQAIAARLTKHPWKDAIISGLRLVMNNNYFTFGDSCWRQLRGTAMGTPVAPAFASLYVAHVEDTLLPEFSSHVIYYKRSIDDIFLLWSPGKSPYSSSTS